MKTENETLSPYAGVDVQNFATALGAWISKSGLFGCSNVEQGQLLAMQCIVERKAPLDLAKLYHIINGKMTLRADAMLAMFRERGGKVAWKQFDGEAASAEFTLDGVSTVISYSRADATLAQLLPARAGSGWAKFPAEMLRARLISKAIRMIAPEVCAGLYAPEEIESSSTPPVISSPTPLLLAAPTVKDFPKTEAVS